MAAADRSTLPDMYVLSSIARGLVLTQSRVKAINYDIELFDLELGGAFTFQGIVKIQVNIKSATKGITLNAHHLTIHEGEISGGVMLVQ